MTQTNLEIAGSARFISSLPEQRVRNSVRAPPHRPLSLARGYSVRGLPAWIWEVVLFAPNYCVILGFEKIVPTSI